MSDDELSQFTVVVSAPDTLRPDAAAVEELALALREALTDAGARRIDQPAGLAAPDGTRAVEILGILTLVITTVQTAEALVKAVRAIQACLRRLQDRRARVHVRTGETTVEIAADSPVEPIVDALRTAPASAGANTRKALIVANSHYDDPLLAQLRGPAKDADALARVLVDPAIGGFDVDLLMDADETTIRRRVARFFADRDRDDVLLLYFSCHGVKDQRGRLYLAARDTELSSVSATAVAASFVNDQLVQTQSQRVLLVLDCCYSGAFTRDAAVRGDRSIHVGDEFGVGTGRIVLTASSATEYSFEGTDLTEAQARPSVFTSAVVEGLRTGEADLGGDGLISVEELYDYTYRQVRQHTPDQTPMKWMFGTEGSLTIARSVKPSALPAQITVDLASDRPALRVEAVQQLALLRTGGNPAMRDRATAELRRLRYKNDSDRVRTAAAQALGSADAGPVAVVAPPEAAAPRVVPAQPTPPEPMTPSPHVQPPGGTELTWSHPLLLAVLGGVTSVTLVELVQALILGGEVNYLAGINVLLAGVPVALVGAWQMRRAGQPRWMLLLLGALVATALQWLTTRQGVNRWDSRWEAYFTFTDAHDDVVGDLLWRWMLVVPALAWYALAGPASPARRKRSMGMMRRPLLLASTLAALVVSLLGAYLIFDDRDRVEFRIIGTPIRFGSYSRALVGLGNLYDRQGANASSGATLLWTVGWLVLMGIAIGVTVEAVRRCAWWWAAAAAVGAVASVVLGFVFEGYYESYSSTSTESLGQYLAVIAVLPALGAVPYAFTRRRESALVTAGR